jgi:hypothetical protein
MTILELDMTPDRFASVAAWLTRADALRNLAEIVESTELEGVYEQVFDTTDLHRRTGGEEAPS